MTINKRKVMIELYESIKEVKKQIEHPTMGKVTMVSSYNEEIGFTRIKYVVDENNDKLFPKNMVNSDKVFFRKKTKELDKELIEVKDDLDKYVGITYIVSGKNKKFIIEKESDKYLIDGREINSKTFLEGIKNGKYLPIEKPIGSITDDTSKEMNIDMVSKNLLDYYEIQNSIVNDGSVRGNTVQMKENIKKEVDKFGADEIFKKLPNHEAKLFSQLFKVEDGLMKKRMSDKYDNNKEIDNEILFKDTKSGKVIVNDFKSKEQLKRILDSGLVNADYVDEKEMNRMINYNQRNRSKDLPKHYLMDMAKSETFKYQKKMRSLGIWNSMAKFKYNEKNNSVDQFETNAYTKPSKMIEDMNKLERYFHVQPIQDGNGVRLRLLMRDRPKPVKKEIMNKIPEGTIILDKSGEEKTIKYEGEKVFKVNSYGRKEEIPHDKVDIDNFRISKSNKININKSENVTSIPLEFSGGKEGVLEFRFSKKLGKNIATKVIIEDKEFLIKDLKHSDKMILRKTLRKMEMLD